MGKVNSTISETGWEVNIFHVAEVRGGYYWTAKPISNCGCLDISQSGYSSRIDLAQEDWRVFVRKERISKWSWGDTIHYYQALKETPKKKGRKKNVKRKSKEEDEFAA